MSIPANWKRRGAQLDLLKANPNWIIFFSSLVTEGRLREIGAEGLAILVVLKTFADWKTSICKMGNRELVYHTNIPINRMRSAIDVLIDKEYLELYRPRPTSIGEYKIFDIITPEDANTGEELGQLRLEYKPHHLQKQRDFIVEGLRKGYFPKEEAKNLHIHIHANIDNRTITQNNISPVHNGTGDINLQLTNNSTDAAAEVAKLVLEAQGYKVNQAYLDVIRFAINNGAIGGEDE